MCGVLRGMRLEPAPAPRRARFSLDVVRPEPRLRFRAYVGDERGTDPTATLGSRAVDDQALSACLSPLTAPIPHTEAAVHFAVGADGRVIRHRVQWPPAIPDKVRGCLDGVLATGRFTCPLSGASEIDARLHGYTLNPR